MKNTISMSSNENTERTRMEEEDGGGGVEGNCGGNWSPRIDSKLSIPWDRFLGSLKV